MLSKHTCVGYVFCVWNSSWACLRLTSFGYTFMLQLNSCIVLTLVSCCLWWRPPVSGTVPPASSSAGTPHRVPVSEDEEGHTGYPATEINSLQQCHNAKQVAGLAWNDLARSAAEWGSCWLPLAWSPAPAATCITAGVSHAPHHEAELDTRGNSHRATHSRPWIIDNAWMSNKK